MNPSCFSYSVLYDPRSLEQAKRLGSRRLFAIGHQSFRRIWHNLYDNCQTLQALVQKSSSSVLHEFMKWVVDNRIQLDWKLPLFFGYWLENNKPWLVCKEKVLLELLTQSLGTWLTRDKSDYMFNVISWHSSRHSVAVVGKKTISFDQGIQLNKTLIEKTEHSMGIKTLQLVNIDSFMAENMDHLFTK